MILPTPYTVTNGADGSVQFDNITFTKAGEYVIEVREVIPDAAVNPSVDDGNTTYADAAPEQKAEEGWTSGNIVYDSHTITSTFQVTDLRGELVVNRTGTTGSRTFTNRYEGEGVLDGAANLEVTKTLNGRDWQEGDSFTFTLTGADDVTKNAVTDGRIELPANASGLTISSDAPDHKATFGDITFHEPGTFVFDITEIKPENADPNMTYDTALHVVTVTVTDAGNGVLNVTVTEGANPEITNTYTEPEAEATAPVSLAGRKVLKAASLPRRSSSSA